MSQVPTRECPKCGKRYAAASPGCPYCDFFPLKPGRAPWMRWIALVVGFAGSVVLAFSMRHWLWAEDTWGPGSPGQTFWGTLIIGVGATWMLVNKLVGGGKDLGSLDEE